MENQIKAFYLNMWESFFKHLSSILPPNIKDPNANCSMKFGPVMLGVFSKALCFYVLLKSRFLRR